MIEKIVIYRSEEYFCLDSNWITWELFTTNGIKYAVMKRCIL